MIQIGLLEIALILSVWFIPVIYKKIKHTFIINK